MCSQSTERFSSRRCPLRGFKESGPYEKHSGVIQRSRYITDLERKEKTKLITTKEEEGRGIHSGLIVLIAIH